MLFSPWLRSVKFRSRLTPTTRRRKRQLFSSLGIEHLEDRTMLSAPGNIEWLSQFGSEGGAEERSQAVDGAGNVYVAGSTSGTFPGQANAGFADAFVRKYDANGNELWTRQFGTSSYDIAFGISVDASGVYVVGETNGTFPGQTSAGDDDALCASPT